MKRCISGLALGLGLACLAFGQAADIQPKNTLNIWPGVAPGSEDWKQQERAVGPAGNQRIFNVVTPTLTVYLPDPSIATGTGVIVAPGGGFRYVTIDSEGYDVAKWLAAKGIAAFVLKYRVTETPAEQVGAPAGGRAPAPAAGRGNSPAAGRGALSNIDENGKHGIADGIQAVKVARRHAAEWGFSPDRLVFVGFSAGAMITSGTLLQPDDSARPNYAAPIYGGPFGALPEIPKGLPPVFLAYAQDDRLAGPPVTRFYDALKAAGYGPELHIFSAGGHGFGMRKQGKSSDHWIDEFYYWMEAQGLTRVRK
jgi:acetyl esterase/lipase